MFMVRRFASFPDPDEVEVHQRLDSSLQSRRPVKRPSTGFPRGIYLAKLADTQPAPTRILLPSRLWQHSALEGRLVRETSKRHLRDVTQHLRFNKANIEVFGCNISELLQYLSGRYAFRHEELRSIPIRVD